MKRLVAVLGLAGAIHVPMSADAQVNAARPLPPAVERQTAVAHWPDSITCHFSARPALDQTSGLPTGRTQKPFTQVARLTLAPATDGRYYYGNGPIADPDEASVPPTGRRVSLLPGAVLGFNADGTPIGALQSDCNGRSIAELIASGQAR